MTNYTLKEVLDIRYTDNNNDYHNKQIIINTKKIINDQYVDNLIKNLESYVTIIYENDNYTNNDLKKNYKYIIDFNLEKDYVLKYAAKYFYLDDHKLFIH